MTIRKGCIASNAEQSSNNAARWVGYGFASVWSDRLTWRWFKIKGDVTVAAEFREVFADKVLWVRN
eukprot:scaffold41760_cov32-Tisochrysis_lutea.AAC.8